MKKSLFSLLLFVLLMPCTLVAQNFVNLTPKPKSMTTSAGSLTLPANLVISHTGLDSAMQVEVTRFAEQLNHATGLNATVKENDATALIQVKKMFEGTNKKEGAYYLNVSDKGATLGAKNALGLFYAFQTVKKVLPANVMAGVKDEKVTNYALPLVVINDEPRYEYRGFMLDVCRHFFTVEEVKRMLDVMAYYKMNRFHWHLTEDQGWRVEIKKYPKLTTVGSIAPNRRYTDMNTCTQYWINRPYGPYFYTQDQIRDVVAYAKERHIEIIPEVDMPGHFSAAMAAYPEFSCTPEGSHVVQSDGGIFSDVMNVGDPKAVQFAKDILSELMDLFPYKTIHIGGDECPEGAWKNNALCQEVYKKEGMTHYRQLQSRFIKEMGEFVKSKGRELAVWNEAISAQGANLSQVTSTDPIVFCWTGPEAAAKKAQELGLKNIYTPWGPYYINRRQGTSPLDPPGAGDGSDHVKNTYNRTIPAATDYGVQGTFWCEHVSDREYMEWLALPRLIAIAEAGWTPQSERSFADFQKRMTADTVLLNYGDYRYCKYFMLDETKPETPQMELPFVNTAEKKYYYRLISGGTDADRKNRCIELIAEGSSLLTQYSGAQVGMLWTNAQAAAGATNYDAQWWSLEEDPAHKGKFALVCKAQPNGSVKATPTSTATSGRWTYDNNGKHYDFVLGASAYGNVGDNHFYSIAANGQHMNSSMKGQGLSVNVYNKPTDGNGGCWQFAPMENYAPVKPVDPIVFTPLTQGKTYVFTNAVEGYNATTLADNNKSNRLTHSTDAFSGNVWTATVAGEAQANGTQVVRLQNVTTGRYISSHNNYVGREGFPVVISTTANDLTLKYEPATKEFRLQVGGKSVFPLPNGMVNAGSNVSADAGYDAPRLQGATWTVKEVKVVTLNCVDDLGNKLGTFKRGVDVATTEITKDLCPTFENMAFEKVAAATAENEYTVTYKRAAFNLIIEKVDTKGAIIENQKVAVPVGKEYTFNAPAVKYYQFESCATPDGTKMTLTKDETVKVVYSTEAYSGVKQVGEAVKELKAGNSYLFFDASNANNNGRQGYRRITATSKVINRYAANAQEMDPSATWTLVEKPGQNKFLIKNEYYNLFIPQLKHGGATTASTTGDTFTFTLNQDGTWKIQGTNGECWDGQENGQLVGWSAPGHPIKAFQYFVQPYFKATVTCVDEEGKTLESSAVLAKAGEAWTLVTPTIEGYDLVSVTGNENYEGILDRNLTIQVNYKKIGTGIETVETPNDNRRQGIYDLQGRKLNRVPQQGIYIINGKKVLVK